MKRSVGLLVLGTLIVGTTTVAGQFATAQVAPDPGFLEPVPASKCTPETPYEKRGWKNTASAQAKGKCERMHFSFGPITVKPGQNDVLLGPVTIEKPWYDGYITRFQPDLVDESGKAPPIDVAHLHHATWLNGDPQYGNGPFFAAGEEKTISAWPRGYGMGIGARDTWLLLYMVHSEVARPMEVWITYDIDFVAKEDAEKAGIVNTKPIWLDVQQKRIAKGAPSTGGNPVYNSQKGFGHFNKRLGIKECSWPDENCARHDVYGGVTPQQGKAIKLAGADWKVTPDMDGTLVLMGGHLHPGGVRDEVSLVRNGKEKLIHISDAVYWDRRKPKVAETNTKNWNSWDFSMTGTGAFFGWKVNLEKGDILRLNSTYETEHSSWYENMGIVMAWVAPKDPHGADGVDVFKDNVTLDRRASIKASHPRKIPYPTGCRPDLKGPKKRLCLRGQVTHGHLAEASNFGGCRFGHCPKLPKKNGPLVDEITMTNFTYGQADMSVALGENSMVSEFGIPRVKKGKTVRFYNLDTFANIWHTVTRCKEPCTGQTGLNYPVANGGIGRRTDKMDFDSTEVGYGVFFSPASGQLGDDDKSTEEALRDGAYWDFKPNRTGTYTFFCRIHHGMRGVIKVVK
jgi:plastocyanin